MTVSATIRRTTRPNRMEGRSVLGQLVRAALFGAVASFALSCRIFTGQFRYAPAPVMQVATQPVRRSR